MIQRHDAPGVPTCLRILANQNQSVMLHGQNWMNMSRFLIAAGLIMVFCDVVLAKAPLASDLRLITVAMKVSQNLERVGDEASKIANRARDLSQEPPLKQVVDIPTMAGPVVQMLKSSLDAFVNHDAAAARALIPKDKEVDALINAWVNKE